MSRPVRHPELWLGTGVIIAVVLSIGLVAFLTRTDQGRAEVLAYTISAAGGRLNGELTIERLEGSLLSGARVYGISIVGEDRQPLLTADSGYVEYEVPTLIGGDAVINELVLYDPDVFLRRMPGDSLWNYQQILADTTEQTTEPRATLIQSLRLVRAEVVVRAPWEPDEELSPDEQEAEIDAALADTSRLMVERVPGGYIRTMFFSLAAAAASDLVIAPEERGGTFLRIDSVAGTVRLWTEPAMELTALRGSVSFNEGVMLYDAERVGIGRSVLETAGVVDLTEEEPRYDLVFTGAGVDLADLQWLYPQLPDEGELGGYLELETRPDGLFFSFRNANFHTPDTQIEGDFGMVVGDTILFTEVELEAAPLRVETIQRMLPDATPIEGLRIGSVVIEAADST